MSNISTIVVHLKKQPSGEYTKSIDRTNTIYLKMDYFHPVINKLTLVQFALPKKFSRMLNNSNITTLTLNGCDNVRLCTKKILWLESLTIVNGDICPENPSAFF